MDIQIGSVVTYHGRITLEHGTVRVVTEIDANGRLTLHDRDYPSITVLRQVRPRSVEPTGEIAELCPRCQHETSWAGHHTAEGQCGICGCVRHDAVPDLD